MKTGACFKQGTQVRPSRGESSEKLSKALKRKRRNSQDGVPTSDNYGGDTILLGFDTEYTPQDPTHNRLLSYQFYACNMRGENEWADIRYPLPDDRLSLKDFLTWVIKDGLEKSTITRWPKQVLLISHFSLADLTGFEDFESLKSEFDAIRRTYISLKDEVNCTVYDHNKHAHKIKVILRDSMLLAPGGSQSLKALGNLVGVSKVELNQGEIEKMDLLLQNDPERFKKYAMQDPKIAVRYCLKIMALNRELFDENAIPPTLSTIGMNFLLKLWQKHGVDKDDVLGMETISEKVWLQFKGHYRTQRKVVPKAVRHDHETVASESFHGGRGEQYFFGASEEATWTDYDLSGAYTTAMGLIGMPHWDQLHTSLRVDDYRFDVLGYARLKFKFPAGTRFPCIPVRTDHGLIFPLEGDDTYCCAPEIDLARSMGAEIEIKNGMILPTDDSKHPFECFITECTTRRKLYAKKSLEELFWKELGNGTYGKTAQGIRRKRRFDTRSGEYDDMPPSKITNPFIAAFVTSFVRAAVGEILSKLPATATVSNVTTDGLLTTATPVDLEAAITGPICRLYSEERRRIVGKAEVIEPKHQIAQVLGMRTRGQATLVPITGQAIVLAKAGLKPPSYLLNEEAQNAWVVDLFIKRDANTSQRLSLLRNLPEIYRHGGDLTQKEVERKISLEYDFKRRPSTRSERSINGVPHLYFDTVPWQNAKEFTACRDAWEKYRSNHGGILKTKADLEGFLAYLAMPPRPGLQKTGKDPSLTTAKRMFLRAYVRSLWGLDAHAMSYAELAEWLTGLGYPTKKSSVENANRPNSKLVEQAVPNTSVVAEFITRVQEKFPSFDANLLLVKPGLLNLIKGIVKSVYQKLRFKP